MISIADIDSDSKETWYQKSQVNMEVWNVISYYLPFDNAGRCDGFLSEFRLIFIEEEE